MKSIKVFLAGICMYFSMAMLRAGGGNSQSGSMSSATGEGGGVAAVDASHVAASGSGGHAGAGGMMNPVDDAEAKPGSRLKERRYVGEDGSEEFAGFYDSMRKEDCGFSVATDGKYRCMPTRAMGLSIFADAQCSVPVGYVSDPPCGGFPVGWYFIKYDTSDPCQYKSIVYSVGAELPAGTPIWGGSPMPCFSTQVSPSAKLWQVGPVVPPASFVAATIVTEP